MKSALSIRNEPLDRYPYYVDVAGTIDRSGLPVSSVLVDNFYLAIALQRRSRFRPVMVWDPAVAFVFDSRIRPIEVRRRLLARDIRLVAVQIKASNNPYLNRYPFYREDAKNWLKVWVVRGLDIICLLPLEEAIPPNGPN